MKKVYSITKQGTQFFIILFAIYWIGFMMIDYLDKHQLITRAVVLFSYQYLTLAYVLIGGIVVWLARRPNSPGWLYTGWFALLLGLFLVFVTYQFFYYQVVRVYGYGNNLFRPLGLTLLYSIPLFLVTFFSYILGTKLFQLIPVEWDPEDKLVLSLGFGISAFILILFFLGSIGQLNRTSLLITFGIISITSFREGIDTLKALVTSQKDRFQDFNYLGYGSFFIILLFASINLTRIISPMPVGSDAQNYYINISRLLFDYGGLAEGFQPYNWSLFISSGYFLSGKTQGALPLAYVAGIFTMLAIFRFGKKVLHIDSNQLMLVCLLFYLTPTVFSQSIAELKIDLGLLFISMVVALVFFHWVKFFPTEPGTNLNPKNRRTHLWLSITVGALLGICMGIKLTTLFLIFSVISTLWYFNFGWQGLITTSLLSLGVSLVARVDEMIGMRGSHLSVNTLQWLLVLAGLIGMAFLFFRNRPKFSSVALFSSIIVFFTVFAFSPWMVKNYRDNPKVTLNTLFQGSSPETLIGTKQLKILREEGLKKDPSKPTKQKNKKRKGNK